MAIVIDDLGTDMGPVKEILGMDIPVALAVLPYQRFSHEAATRAFEKGREVLLHLPLEPRGYPMTDPGPGCILVGMDRERIQRELQDQIASLPHCIGVNPHMGSLFEEHPGPLTSLIAVLKERELMLVDNGASPASQAALVARNCGVRCVHRTHFLDERREEAFVIRQLCSLADYAARNGWGLGIGHPYPETLAALPRVRAAFREKNVALVRVSDLLPSQGEAHERSAGSSQGPEGLAGCKVLGRHGNRRSVALHTSSGEAFRMLAARTAAMP